MSCRYVDAYISIHTTAKVVTQTGIPAGQRDDISIHTTAKVVTSSLATTTNDAFISIHTTAKVVTAKTSNFPLMFLYKNTNFLIIMIIKSLPSTSCYIIHLLFDTFLGANDPRFLCQLGIRTKKSKSNQPQFPYPHQNVPL